MGKPWRRLASERGPCPPEQSLRKNAASWVPLAPTPGDSDTRSKAFLTLPAANARLQPRALALQLPQAGSFASSSSSPQTRARDPRATPLSYPHARALQPPYLAAAAARPRPSSPPGGADVRGSLSPFTRTSPRLHQASSREMSAGWLGPEAENYSHSREGGSHAGARHSGSMPTNCRLAAAAPAKAAAILVRGAGEHAQ